MKLKDLSIRHSFITVLIVYRRLSAFAQAIQASLTLLEYSKQLMTWSEPGKLIPSPTNEHLVSSLLKKVGKPINQYCFYGRCLGIQVRQEEFTSEFIRKKLGLFI